MLKQSNEATYCVALYVKLIENSFIKILNNLLIKKESLTFVGVGEGFNDQLNERRNKIIMAIFA